MNNLLYLSGKIINSSKLIEKSLSNYKKNSLRVVYYHMVSEKDHDYYFPQKAIRPKVFIKQIKYLKKNYDIISLKEALYITEKKKSLEKKLIITFDDGFKENYSVIAPILNELNVPAVFFFISNCIDNKDLMWRNKLLLIQKYAKKNMEELDIEFSNRFCFRLSPKNDILKWSYSKWPMNQKEEIVNYLCSKLLPFTISEYLEKKTPYCSAAQVKELYSNDFEIGSHSLSHPIFSKLDYKSFLKEILISSNNISKLIGDEICALSYPFGIRAHRKFENKLLMNQDKIKFLLGTKNHLNNNINNFQFWERDNLEFSQPVMKFRLLVLPIIRKVWQY